MRGRKHPLLLHFSTTLLLYYFTSSLPHFTPTRIVAASLTAGLKTEYTVTGSQMEIFGHYGLTADGLASTARALVTAEAAR